MDKKSKAILAGFTGKRKRSRLAPHRDLICKLHRRRCAFREIVSILSENFNLTVVPSTVCRFIARLEKEETTPQKAKPRKERPVPIMTPMPKNSAPSVESPDEIRQRIAALKQRAAQPEPEKKRFEYDPCQPLHLFPKATKI